MLFMMKFLAEAVKDVVPPAEVGYPASFAKMIIILVILLGLLFLTVYVFKKLAKSRLLHANQMNKIKILEKRAISPKSMLYLIEVNDEKVLISESQINVSPISKRDYSKSQKEEEPL